MARRSLKPHPLPDWFNLNAYNSLLDINNESLIKEVTSRSYLYSSEHIENTVLLYDLEPLKRGEVLLETDAIYDSDDIPEMVYSEITAIGPDFIAPGIPRITIEQLPEPVERPKDKESLAGGNSIWPLDFSSLLMANLWAEKQDIFRPGKPDPGGYSLIKTEYMLASVSAHSENGRVEAAIDLDGSTDAEILEELRELLPMWRKQLNLPEPAKNECGVVGPSTIKRMIEYRVIPMLDLMIWAKINGFEYSAEQLSRVLYPDVIVSAKHVNDTRKPFAMKFMDENYTDMINLWIKQIDRDTGKRNGCRIVKDTIEGIG